ncbi:MAG: hypothetical protein H7Y33_01740 [Cytophagales bacterium]|nr:hypothetical protein [Rhizobacter sp.]
MAFGTQIWLCIRVGRSSVALAIVTFFIGFPGAVYTLFTRRGDKESTVTVPFVFNLVFTVLFFMSVWQTLLPRLEAMDTGLDEPVVASAPATQPVLRASPVVSAAAEPPTASSVQPAPAAPAPDAIDAYAAALRAAGLNHTVTRMAASTSLPAGVTDAALFSVTLMSAAASTASAASAAAGSELSATLFKCETAAACRNLAGAYMQQTGPEKRRVLQNGLLMLLMPQAARDDPDLTPAAVASTFRKL